jgi:hypothetical protein
VVRKRRERERERDNFGGGWDEERTELWIVGREIKIRSQG